MARAERTDPKLWEKVKEEITRSDKGGAPGQWSARKAQMAVQAYKKRGGGYSDKGPKQEQTDLHGWTEADWGTRSGRESGRSGERYLPKAARMLLTDDEYARSTAKKRKDTGIRGTGVRGKGGRGEQFSDQPEDVREKVARIRSAGPTRAMLDERARELGIEGRSGMSKDRLVRAIEAATDGDGRGKAARAKGAGGAGPALENMTKGELYRRAQAAEVQGRSSMSKDQLIEAMKGR